MLSCRLPRGSFSLFLFFSLFLLLQVRTDAADAKVVAFVAREAADRDGANDAGTFHRQWERAADRLKLLRG